MYEIIIFSLLIIGINCFQTDGRIGMPRTPKNITASFVQIYDVKENVFRCGGVIVAIDWILTAAHCVRNLTEYETQVFFDQKFYKVERFSFPENNNTDDIVMIKLNGFFKLSKKKPVKIRSTGLKPEIYFILGIGIKDSDSTEIQTAAVPVLNSENCQKKYNFDPPIKNNEFCAATEEMRQCNERDAGGPAIDRSGYLVGILSKGPGCIPNTPGVFTNVINYCEWIKNHFNSEKYEDDYVFY